MIPQVESAERIYLDTSPFVYFIEVNQEFSPLVRPIMLAINSGERVGLCSYLTLIELLVKPIADRRTDLVRIYRTALLEDVNLQLFDVGRSVAEEAARIGATYGYKTPDAILLATALLQRADVFVTNDIKLRRFPEVPVVVLKDHLEHQ